MVDGHEHDLIFNIIKRQSFCLAMCKHLHLLIFNKDFTNRGCINRVVAGGINRGSVSGFVKTIKLFL